MIVLSIDQSLAQSGWALLGSGPVRLMNSGIIPTKRNGDDPANLRRLALIYTRLSSLMTMFERLDSRPDLVIIERYFSRNYQGTLAVAEVRGIIKLFCAVQGLRFIEVPPQTVRKEVLGNGRAEKEDVARAVRQLVTVPDTCTLDETDAIAMGIYALRKYDTNTTEQATNIQQPRISGSSARTNGVSGDTRDQAKRRGRRRVGSEKATGKGD